MNEEHSENESAEEVIYEDPRYRRTRPSNFKPYEKDTSQSDLIATYAPRIRWICWVGLLTTLLFAADYFIPYNSSEEKIEKVIKQRRGNTRHYYLIFLDAGQIIKLYDDKAWYFSKETVVKIKRSRIFKTVMSAEKTDGTLEIAMGYVYRATVFFPILLFLISVLGLLQWKTKEFPFNLAIVSALLLLVNLVLMVS
jgi:hypothetical protein